MATNASTSAAGTHAKSSGGWRVLVTTAAYAPRHGCRSDREERRADAHGGGGGLAATATHTGPIAEIGDTHQAVRAWSQANGYRLAGPHWEIYGDPDPSTGDFDVDVFWSLLAT